jgi:hypothetical protein
MCWGALLESCSRNTSVAVTCVVLQRYQPNRVQWVNDLKDSQGNFLPHIFDYAVDQTLHW